MRPKTHLLVLALLLTTVSLFGQASDCSTPNPKNCSPIPDGTPTPFAGDTGPMRVRKNIFDLSSTELATYQKAVQAYRDLPFSDPRSWCRQANVHCYNCSGGNSGVEIHLNYAFLPWHRAYLYFYEKILGELVGDPTFALPYWDWNAVDTPACQQNFAVPSSYTTGSLNDPYRRKRPAGDGMDPSVVGASVVNDIILDNPDVPDFMGTESEDSIMWPTPHGPVHNWVGQAPPGRWDMGWLTTAARDPIFFAHHNNVDRIWDEWATFYSNPTYPSDYLAQTFTFYNEKSQWVSITAADMSLANLNYVFQPPSQCGQAPQSTSTTADTVKLGSTPTTVMADIREAPQPAPTTGRFAGKRVVLHIDDVRTPSFDEAVIRVFLNKPDATPVTPTSDPHFVAAFANVESGHGADHDAHLNRDFTFRLNADHLRIIEEAGGNVQITLVPKRVTRSRGLESVEPPLNVQVVTAKPYLTVEEPRR